MKLRIIFYVALLLLNIQTILAYDFESGGIYYSIDGNNVSVTSGDSKYKGDIAIPKQVTYNGKTYSVKSIGRNAFFNCSGLTSITIPNSVTNIGEDAFYKCSGLTSITIPNSVTSIGDMAFAECSGLTTFTIPNSVTSIGEFVFVGCSGLTSITIPNSVTSIGEGVFQRCSGLTSITIPNSVTSIGGYTFYECFGLTSITIPNSVTSIGDYTFYECFRLTSITIPNSVTSIGRNAFGWCIGLTSIISEIMNPFKISEDVFSDYSEPTLTVPRGTKTAYQSTDGWKKFTNIVEASDGSSEEIRKFESGGITYNINDNGTSVTVTAGGTKYQGKISIPSSVSYNGKSYNVTSIGQSAFYGCSGLTSITIPNSVTSIGESAFSECCGLTSITIPNSVTSIGESAFCGCNGLTSITIPNSVTGIGECTFTGCSGLTSITIPNSVTYIEESAFYGCCGLTSITIPNSVTYIGRNAFYLCSGLTSITIPKSVAIIAIDAFSGCSGLLSINVESGNTEYDSRNGCNAIIATATNSLITGCKNTTIPNSVTYIGRNAFSGCSGLTSIKIPNSVSSIGYGAFSGCSGLTSIVSEIENPFDVYCFDYNTHSEATLNVPAGTKAKYQSTEGWKQFTNIVETSGGSSEEIRKFESGGITYNINDNGTSVTVTAGSTKYQGEISIPSSVSYNGKSYNVTSIGYGAFFDCTGLTSISIPNSVMYIEYGGFQNCSGLSSVTLPNSIVSIAQYAFYGCGALGNVYSDIISPFDIDIQTFGGISKTATLHITKGTKSRYQQYSGWTEPFASIVEDRGVTTYTLSISSSGKGSVSYNNENIRNTTKSYTVEEGTSVTIKFTPDTGCRIKSVKVNNSDVTSKLSNSKYTVTINSKITVKVEFEENLKTFTSGGINYSVFSYDDKTVKVCSGEYGLVLEVPASVNYQNITWKVVGIEDAALSNSKQIAAIIWNPSANFTINVNNPNLLLYVKDVSYAPSSIKNVVVNSRAGSVVLSDDGSPFYCPQTFTAGKISYTHYYNMETGGNGKGWETLALPFNVQKIQHSTRGEIVPFASYNSESYYKPFWLATMSSGNFRRTSSIQANTPYIIAMPNSSNYQNDYNLAGDVTFSAENVSVPKTPTFSGTFVPTYTTVSRSSKIYALNVMNKYVSNTGSYSAGSRFISNLRDIRPFEAYISSGSSTRGIIEIGFDEGTTGMENILLSTDGNREIIIYTISGRKVGTFQQCSLNEALEQLPKGVYIVNGRKIVK